jgi:hypothetical protein
MSDSYPTIQDSLSEVQKEFMGCVEMHLDPPEHSDPSYRVESLYRMDNGSGIRFEMSVDETDPEISERRHTIEFVSLSNLEDPLARVSHSLKRVEASQGRFFWTESQFRVAGPDVPAGTARGEDVEEEVKTYVERVRELDRYCKLVEV